MQVSAYDIVCEFGIDALRKFQSFENQDEINQVRYEWDVVHKVLHTIGVFSAGESVFEVVFCPDSLTAYRTDNNSDVTGAYLEQILDICETLDRYRNKLGLERRAYLFQMFRLQQG